MAQEKLAGQQWWEGWREPPRQAVGWPCVWSGQRPEGCRGTGEMQRCWESAQAAEGFLGAGGSGPTVFGGHSEGRPVDKWRGSWWFQGTPEKPGKLQVS